MKQRFHWRDGNRIDLMVDGENFFPVMLREMDRARHCILLEFYIVSSGRLFNRFMAAMLAAVNRGVRVQLIIDGFGALNFSSTDRNRLESAGVQVVVYNPLKLLKWTRNFARDHRKLLIIDKQIAFIGGAGLSDEYWLSDSPGGAWHDLMGCLQGPVVADLQVTYKQLWSQCQGLNYLSEETFCAPVGEASVRVTTVQGISQQDIKARVLQQINQAEDTIWLVTAYFLPSFSMRTALRRAARRGVDVRLIIAGPYTDVPWVYHASKRYYRALLKAGVRLYEYQPRFLHAKAALIDSWTTLGSSNLDHWNMRWNLEANIEVRDRVFTAHLAQVLRDDMAQSEEVTLAVWAQRAWHKKIIEYIWAWLARLALKIR
ncbi:MAG: phospholipase D-like domain-containing protein [Pontibacterium sp.]